MARLTALLCLYAAGIFGGCNTYRVCPPIQGTVIDATSGRPVESAHVRIKYYYHNSERTARTNAQGQFAFEAKYRWLPGFNLTFESSFELEVTADDYEQQTAGMLSMAGFFTATETPPRRVREFEPLFANDAKEIGAYTGKVLILDPIELQPTTPIFEEIE